MTSVFNSVNVQRNRFLFRNQSCLEENTNHETHVDGV